MESVERNYDNYNVEHDGKIYNHLSYLKMYYRGDTTPRTVYAEGGGSMNVPNDLAMSHSIHHILVLVRVDVIWYMYQRSSITPWMYVGTGTLPLSFVLGDDNPAETDCLLYVEQGDTAFSVHTGSSGGGGGGGGCPYVYAWDGQQYVMDNNLLPASEMSNGADVEDRYMLEQPLVPIYQGTAFSLYSLQIREFEHEHDFIDQVKLIALDHASDVKIAVTPKGEILTYKQPLAPLSCIDNYGTSRLNEIVSMDGNVSDTTTYFEEYPSDYLILNFGKVDAENAKLILRDDMKCMDVCIEVQVPSQTGDWQTVEVLNPRNYWAIEAVDLSKYVVENEDLLVRLYWTSPHRLDYVGLDTSSQASIEVHQAFLLSAFHSTQGNVKPLLMKNDQTYAELTPGQQIQLTFQLPNNQNQKRTFILYTEGHYTRIET